MYLGVLNPVFYVQDSLTNFVLEDPVVTKQNGISIKLGSVVQTNDKAERIGKETDSLTGNSQKADTLVDILCKHNRLRKCSEEWLHLID